MIIFVDENDENTRIDNYLSGLFPDISRSKIQGFIKNGSILVNNSVKKPAYTLKNGDKIEFEKLENEEIKIEPQNIPLDIIYEDENMLVVNKPSGMLTHPTSTERENTLVNALLNELSQICPHDRVISIEDTKELKIQVKNKIALFTSQTSDMSVLLKSALRLRPDRLIVGEVRGSEALDLIDAFSTGHSGGFTTLHAGSIDQALKRLTLLISRHEHAPRLIEPTLAEALDLIVQVQRTPSRHISAIAQVTGFSEGVFHVKNIFNNK